jgi:hypothetical protein
VCIYATREGDYVLFHHEGGVDVGDVDAKAQKLLVGVDEKLNTEDIKRHLLVHAPEDKKELSSERERRGHKWGQEVQCDTGDQCTGLGTGERKQSGPPCLGATCGGRVRACNQCAVCQPHPSPPCPCLAGAFSVPELDSFFPPQCLKSDSLGNRVGRVGQWGPKGQEWRHEAGLSATVSLLEAREWEWEWGAQSCTDELTGLLSLSLLESWPASSLVYSISTRICTSPTLRSTPLVTRFICCSGMGMGPHAYSNSGLGVQRAWALVPEGSTEL